MKKEDDDMKKKKKDVQNDVIAPTKEQKANLTRSQRKEVKRQLKKARNAKKEVAKLSEKTSNTILDWSDLTGVYDNYMTVGKHGDPYIVMGIKVTPHNIFLDDEMTQGHIINQLRMAYNRLNFTLYHTFVTTPVDLDDYEALLHNFDSRTDDKTLKNMNNSDYAKAEEFEALHRELEFMIFTLEKDPKKLEKNLNDLFSSYEKAGLSPKVLVKKDFLNFLNWLYENPLCNAYYFSRGIFSEADIVYRYNADKGELEGYKPEEEEDFNKRILEIETLDSEDDMKALLSKAHPTALRFKPDSFILGDKYCTMIHVLQLPSTYYIGFLCDFIGDHDVKVFMRTDPYSVNMAQMLKKDYMEKLETYNRSKDPTQRTMLEKELMSQDEYLHEVIANNDKTRDVQLSFMVSADSEKELRERATEVRERLKGLGFKITRLITMQEQAFRMVNPVLLDSSLPKVNRENFGFPLPSKGVAGLYPYVFDTLKDKYGFLLGYEMQNGGVMIFDHFAYQNEKEKARATGRLNGNMVVVGKSGSGKTVFSLLVLRKDIKEQFNIVAIDPENKIFDLMRMYGGQIVNYGVGDSLINVFDLRPLSSDIDVDDQDYNREKEERLMWNTHNAINHVIGNITSDFEILFKSFSDEEAAILGDVIRRAYAKKGITDDSFRYYTSDQMPTYSDVKGIVEEVLVKLQQDGRATTREYEYYQSLQHKLSRICGEWGIYFDGHTTVRTTYTERKLIAFGTKHLQNVNEKLQVVLKRIMYDYAWTLCIDNAEKSVFFLDEAHTDILKQGIADRVAQFARRARKYNTCLLLATQEPRDFHDPSVLTQGKAIFNNCAYKMIMQLEKDPLKDLADLVSLNESELELILGFSMAEGLFIVGNQHYSVRVYATEQELAEIGA